MEQNKYYDKIKPRRLEKLIADVSEGQAGALEQLYDAIKTAVYSYALSPTKNAIDANVVSTWLTGNSDAKKIASDYGISLGKAELITKILAADTSKTHTAETLAVLNINDLTLIFQGLVTEKVGTGEAGDKSYIGQNAAQQIAFEAVGDGVNAQTIQKLKTKMDYEDGSMVYEVEFDDNHGKKTVVEVEFVAGAYEYELKIDVNTNSVLKCSKERA